jgi:hypothetical protein
VVALGHGAALPIDEVDLAVTPRGEAIFSHPRLVEVDRPLVASPSRGGHRAGSGGARIAAAPGPRIVLRLDGRRRDGEQSVDATLQEVGDLARLVRESAARLGGSVLLWAAPGCSTTAFEACRNALGEVAFAEHASGASSTESASGEADWSALLAAGDVFVFAGSSDSALAEITATGRPVFLAYTAGPTSRRGLVERVRQRFADAVVARARSKPANDRGTTRPQEGLEWLCAKLVAEGRIRPRNERDSLGARLLAGGHIRILSSALMRVDLGGFPPPPENELERVAARIRALLGAPPAP